MQDCAAAMGVEAVILGKARRAPPSRRRRSTLGCRFRREKAGLDRRVVTTVEYRGLRDVERAYAKSDAEGIYRLLATRGVIADEKAAKPRKFTGIAAPIGNVEMIAMPRGGAILFHVEPGQRVERARSSRPSCIRRARKTARPKFSRRRPAMS